jgi:hypothetical protein
VALRQSWVLGALVLAAFGGRPTPYTFPGCEDAGRGEVCPPANRLDCALAIIGDRFNHCTRNTDCVALRGGESCVGGCGAAVNAELAGAFRDQACNEANRFQRGDNGCTVFNVEPCVLSSTVVAAGDAGRCVIVDALGDGG